MSIVIPVKDDAGHLTRCLQSLRRQTRPPFEVIVVDNGSSDDSADVARRFGATVIPEDIPGIAAAASCGYDHATGSIIARLDADSTVSADWVDTLQNVFRDRVDVDAVTGSAVFTDGPVCCRHVAARLYLGAYFVTASTALSHLPLFGSNFAMRKEAWAAVRNDVHRADTTIHDDFDLAFHLGRTHRVRYLRHLRVGISMRPLLEGEGVLRARRGFRTVAIHWPHDFPWLRLARRLTLRYHQSRTQKNAWSPTGRFHAALVLDAVNVGALIAAAVRDQAKTTPSSPWAKEGWGVALVASGAWFLAAAAARQLPPDCELEYAAGAISRARRLTRLGLWANSIGSAAVIAFLVSKDDAGRGPMGRAVYLLGGGAAISVVYLRSLDKIASCRASVRRSASE